MQSTSCSICLKELTKEQQVRLLCSHVTCQNCLVSYIETLKKYKELTPQKLKCLTESCKTQIDDNTISKLFKGQEGFILNIIKKRYKESQNPLITIFSCQGFTRVDRKPLIQKTAEMSREQHSILTNPYIKSIIEGKQILSEKKMCTNILSFNRGQITKDKYVQCYVCGLTYCVLCLNISHEGKCLIQEPPLQISNHKNNDSNQTFEHFVSANQMIRCLNKKCGIVIAKQEGCYWVKCRCSWQFCYPCQQLWGNCEHFSKYPYKKFVPPPEWMVKALNLY